VTETVRKNKLFGTFSGVFVPSFEAILGAVLFLILPMLTGAMGLWRMALIIVISNTVTIATAFSISDCVTNIERVGAGGMYAVSRRSLGRAFGGSIGIQLFLAQSASIGFYSIGFAQPLQGILLHIPFFNHFLAGYDVLTQKQLIATVVALIAFVFGIIGANFIVKIQMFIFIILILSVVSILITPFIKIPGVRIFSGSINWEGISGVMGFWAAFTAFFPAVTGIDAGVGMSGNLANPRRSLSKGTFLSILVTFLVYLSVTFVYSLINPDFLRVSPDGQVPSVVNIFAKIPVIPYLLLTGILVATSSSALSYFMTAPRTAQALARDKILPKLFYFLERDFTRNGKEPRLATLFALLVILPIIWSGDVTHASTVVGILFLIVYGWVNFAAFLERISGNPSFRPTSHGHWAISLYGFLLCMIIIALFNVWVGIVVFISQTLIFVLLLKYKSHNRLEGVWWGVVFSALTHAFKQMKIIVQGTKNWRPIVSVFGFVDKPEEVASTVEMGNRIADYQGLIMYNLLKPEKTDDVKLDLPLDYRIIEVMNDNYSEAILSVVQSALPGGLHVNTALFPIDNRLNYIEIIERMIRAEINVLLYKHGTGYSVKVVGEDIERVDRIDVWWKGEENGNLMALLSYIISVSDERTGKGSKVIRLIRKLKGDEEERVAQEEMETLLQRARLKGEILIIPEDEKPIHESIREFSSDAVLILMGMPGEKREGIAKIFSLDRLFFTKELERFDHLPPMLFVKASKIIDLFEE